MSRGIDDLVKGASEVIKGVHDSPALMLATDLSLIKNLLPKLDDSNRLMLEELQQSKELNLLSVDRLNKMVEALQVLPILASQLQSVETELQMSNALAGRLLYLSEFGTTRILSIENKTISGGRKTDLFRGYDEAGRLQSVLLDFSHDQVEGHINLDSGKIEFSFETMKQLDAYNPSGKDWWISRYDDTNNRYVLQFTPSTAIPFDKRCWLRIWNRSSEDLIVNVGNLTKQVKPLEQTDVKAREYGRDVMLERSKKLRDTISKEKGDIF